MPAKQNQELPNWIRGRLDQAGLERIQAAVARAESKTSAELVPMIVHSSTHTRHAPYLIFFAILSVLLAVVPFVSTFSLPLDIWWIEVLAILLAGGLAIFGAQLDRVRYFTVTKADRDSSVLMRAQLEFYESNIKATQGQTGILIFVSWMEREAVVLADQAIAKELPDETWTQVIEVLLTEIRRGDFAGGFCAAIDRCGDILAQRFPAQAANLNELKNHLRIEE